MIREVRIENFKSIPKLTVPLGRFNVLIGANGSGKSNILEAITFAAAASQHKLENEFLISRGIRVAESRFMYSAFHSNRIDNVDIKISVEPDGDIPDSFELLVDESASYPKWTTRKMLSNTQVLKSVIGDSNDFRLRPDEIWPPEFLEKYYRRFGGLHTFLIYAPKNSALRTFQSEGQILPLGIRGEGLFAHLKALNAEKYRKRLERIKAELTLIDWFETFDIPGDLSLGERSIRIRDRFLPDGALFDQRSANEGFLFLLFYITLFISPDTPAFFSIDNIDTSLNPKLCSKLISQLYKLAKEFDKQVILTTHNPAVLDGLNLNDDEQRLLVVDRNKEGHTRIRRIESPKVSPNETPVSLSEAFLRGYIGGLPKNF